MLRVGMRDTARRDAGKLSGAGGGVQAGGWGAGSVTVQGAGRFMGGTLRGRDACGWGCCGRGGDNERLPFVFVGVTYSLANGEAWEVCRRGLWLASPRRTHGGVQRRHRGGGWRGRSDIPQARGRRLHPFPCRRTVRGASCHSRSNASSLTPKIWRKAR